MKGERTKVQDTSPELPKDDLVPYNTVAVILLYPRWVHIIS
jgi:hypothetical protein